MLKLIATAIVFCLIIAIPSVATASNSYQDNGGAQPGQNYPGGNQPDKPVPTGGGSFPGQVAPKEPHDPKPPGPRKVRARILASGKAAISSNAPLALKQLIQAANQIIGKPYLWGGGHANWISKGYDCSGSVSYALHGAGLLEQSLVSGELMNWGVKGAGLWVDIYANKHHAYMEIAGIRLDTSWVDDPLKQHGTRWRPARSHNRGFVLRHPAGL